MKFLLDKKEKSITSDIEKKGFSLSQNDLTKWLISKNLLSEKEVLLCFKDIQPWQRTGGETYTTYFYFKTNLQEQTIVAKAIVTTNPEKSLIDWKKRRELLAEHNIPVSHWYCSEEATIYELFYPQKSEKVNDFILLLKIAFTLDMLGFSTLKFLDDILCDKNGNPFYVDFGFDLGEPSLSSKTNAKDFLIKKYPHKKAEINFFYENKLL